MKSKKTIKILLSILAIIILAGGIALFKINQITSTKFNIDKPIYIYVDQNKDYNKLLSDLQSVAKIENIEAFKTVADFYDYPQNIKTGRYAITPQTTVRQLVNELRRGTQTPVKLKFNNIRTKDDLAERLSEQLMISKEEILTALNDSSLCAKYGLTPETITTMFIPNTYEVYWDTKLDSFLDRMNKEHKRFWTEERLKKAEQQKLSPIEASILAAIVEEECYYTDEYPRVAGLYLNRLHRGQKLQADPTVKYAVGDFGLRRILFKHLETDSPYNTYMYVGLPPGAIRVPSIKGIDAVLNAENHEYLYMCAKEDFSGRHNFAKTHAEHERNASKYRNALNTRGIYK